MITRCCPRALTVAHLSFYLARYMGCNPIVLVGQDLGFEGNVYYAPGTPIERAWSSELNRFNSMEMMEWQRIARMRSVLQKVPDIHGRKIFTDAQMFTYLQQFERDVAVTEATVIDATEGGARITGTKVVPLKEVIDRYCTAEGGCATSSASSTAEGPASPGSAVAGGGATFSTSPRRREDAAKRCGEAARLMKKRLRELERMDEVCEKVLAACAR